MLFRSSQGFSLYSELTVRQNLVLHARLFSVPEADIEARVQQMLQRFGLQAGVARLPDTLPMGMRQRLQLAYETVQPLVIVVTPDRYQVSSTIPLGSP